MLEKYREFTGKAHRFLDLKQKRFIFEVIPEKEQTIGSLYPVIFSVGYDNTASLIYSQDVLQDVTIAYAGGAGTDENRLIQTVSRTPEEGALSGYDRRECWLDVGSAETVADLEYEGQYQLSKMEKIDTLSGQVLPNETFAYIKDWDLGSVVTLQSHALGIQANKKITGIKEIYEKGKVDIDVTFGKRTKNILDEIRRIEVIR